MGVIDLAQTTATESFAKNALKKFGISDDIGAAIGLLASTIRDHRHLETILTSCGPEERQILYDSVVPHLRFTARPLDSYVASAGQMAERLKLPTMDAEGKLHEFQPARDVKTIEKDAEKAMAAAVARRTLTLVCAKCTRQERFIAVGDETPVAVIMRARKAGWIYDYLATPPREICAECPTSLRLDA